MGRQTKNRQAARQTPVVVGFALRFKSPVDTLQNCSSPGPRAAQPFVATPSCRLGLECSPQSVFLDRA